MKITIKHLFSVVSLMTIILFCWCSDIPTSIKSRENKQFWISIVAQPSYYDEKTSNWILQSNLAVDASCLSYPSPNKFDILLDGRTKDVEYINIPFPPYKSVYYVFFDTLPSGRPQTLRIITEYDETNEIFIVPDTTVILSHKKGDTIKTVSSAHFYWKGNADWYKLYVTPLDTSEARMGLTLDTIVNDTFFVLRKELLPNKTSKIIVNVIGVNGFKPILWHEYPDSLVSNVQCMNELGKSNVVEIIWLNSELNNNEGSSNE